MSAAGGHLVTCALNVHHKISTSHVFVMSSRLTGSRGSVIDIAPQHHMVASKSQLTLCYFVHHLKEDTKQSNEGKARETWSHWLTTCRQGA
jgi:hypothetical protein